MKWPFLATLTTAGTLVALVAPAWQDLTQTTPDGLGKPPVVSAAAAPAGTETLAVKWVKVTAPDLGVMLAAADLSGTDLRWTDLSEANLIRANLTNCDLVKTNFTRTILCAVSLTGADLSGTRFFYGKAETASPRSRTEPPHFKTGLYTGAVIENADFTNAEDMSDDQRYYCCAWGGSKTRSTIPGGCEGIPNKLGR